MREQILLDLMNLERWEEVTELIEAERVPQEVMDRSFWPVVYQRAPLELVKLIWGRVQERESARQGVLLVVDSYDVLKFLLEEVGADPNEAGGEGETPLGICMYGVYTDEDARKAIRESLLLLRHGADPYKRSHVPGHMDIFNYGKQNIMQVLARMTGPGSVYDETTRKRFRMIHDVFLRTSTLMVLCQSKVPRLGRCSSLPLLPKDIFQRLGAYLAA